MLLDTAPYLRFSIPCKNKNNTVDKQYSDWGKETGVVCTEYRPEDSESDGPKYTQVERGNIRNQHHYKMAEEQSKHNYIAVYNYMFRPLSAIVRLNYFLLYSKTIKYTAPVIGDEISFT